MPEIKFRHTVPIQVRFNDLDVLGHVTNALYQIYYSQAGVSYYQAVLERHDGKVNFVMASITIDYLKSIMFNSAIAVQIRVARIGGKSFEFHSRIIDRNDGSVYSRSISQEVCFDRQSQSTVSMPRAWRDSILAYEPTSPLIRV